MSYAPEPCYSSNILQFTGVISKLNHTAIMVHIDLRNTKRGFMLKVHAF
jgi:hypothetical protein